MAIEIPPVITPVPTPAIQRGDRVTFSSRVDAFVIWLVSAVSQFGAVATNVYNNAVIAASSATAALSNKGLSQQAADAAESYRTQAKNSADAAAASATTIGTTAAFSDANPIAKNAADNSKQLKISIANFPTNTTNTITIPNKSGTMAMLEDSGLGFLGEIVLATATANIDFLNVFNGGLYDRFLITVQNANSTISGNTIAIRYATAGVVDSSSAYNSGLYGEAFAGQATSLSLGAPSSGNPLQLDFTLLNNDAGNSKRSHVCSPAGTFGELLRGFYYRASPAPLSGFRVFATNGSNLIAGTTVRVYGFKKA